MLTNELVYEKKNVVFTFPLFLGRLLDCGFYDADAWVCLSEDQKERKYDWIEYEDGTRLGTKSQCKSK